MRNNELKTRKDIKEWVKKGREQPLLVDRFNMSKGGKEYQAKLNATLDYVKVLKEQGLNPNEFLT